jgi:Zn-dependent protease
MITLISWILAFIIAITIHEAAHAWMSDRLGDPTAKLEGRLTLNPIKHYDPIGTTLLLVLVFMRALGAPVIPFGWAKPVGFDPYNLKNPRKDTALISLAGPGANLALAAFLSLILRLAPLPFTFFGILPYIFEPTIILCVALAVFNLIPIHPLDGGKIIVGLLPKKDAYEYDKFITRYGTFLLLLIILPTLNGNSPASIIITPVIDFILKLLIPGGSLI